MKKIVYFTLLISILLKADDFLPDNYEQKGFIVECDSNTSTVSITSSTRPKIWGHNLKTNNYEMNLKYLEKLKKEDNFYVPFDLKMQCKVNNYTFSLEGFVPKRDATGWCGYNPDPYISISLNDKYLIKGVPFDETCTGYTSLTKIVLTLKDKPKMQVCIKDKPFSNDTSTCHTLGLNEKNIYPLGENKLNAMQVDKTVKENN
jgi:hypothetical protein